MLTLNNKAEAGGPPPVTPTPIIDPKTEAKDVVDKLTSRFSQGNLFGNSQKKTKNQTNNHAPKLDPKKEQDVLLNLLSGDFYDAKKRLSVIKDVVKIRIYHFILK